MSSLTSGWPTGSWTSPLLESELETDALYGIESLDWKAPCLVDDAAFANTQLVSDAFVSTASADVPATEQLNYSRDQSFSPRRLTYFGVSGAQSLLERRNVNTTFADDHLLDTPEIDMLRAFLSIASRLRCTDRVWSLSSTSVFHDPPPDLRLEDVPHHLLPTRTQQTVLHHPGIDTLPWPGVRNRLLAVWSLPEEHWSRHPSDGESCNMLKLFQGLESGGVKIWGPDPTAIDALEIQQSFFNVWWWALDHTAIAASNKRRLARGSRRLTIAEA